MKLSHILLLSASLFSFQVHAMDPYDIVEKVYDDRITYSSGIFNHYKDGDTLSTQAQRPQKSWNQNSLVYAKKSQEFTPEAVLKKVVPGKDGRERISNTTTWPYSIHTQLSMVFNGDDYGGSGVMVGPHHLLTCAHCVYNFDKKYFFNEISVYPALNGKVAPFDKVKVTKSYLFKSWRDQGNQQFDIALLLLDQPIGDYVGWGGLLSIPDTDLSQEKVHITGYPGDKGFKQMWSMSHKIKTVKPEQFDYEIDTHGGQSGSAVWINKWGTPMILGVHTLGSDSMNSGVRLSGKKFTDLLLKVISDNYVLNNISSPSVPVTIPINPPPTFVPSEVPTPMFTPSAKVVISEDKPVNTTYTPLMDTLKCKDKLPHIMLKITTKYLKPDGATYTKNEEQSVPLTSTRTDKYAHYEGFSQTYVRYSYKIDDKSYNLQGEFEDESCSFQHQQSEKKWVHDDSKKESYLATDMIFIVDGKQQVVPGTSTKIKDKSAVPYVLKGTEQWKDTYDKNAFDTVQRRKRNYRNQYTTYTYKRPDESLHVFQTIVKQWK